MWLLLSLCSWCIIVLYRASSGVQDWKPVCHSAAACFGGHAGTSGFIPRFHATCRLFAVQTQHIATSQRVAVDVGTPAASGDWNSGTTAIQLWHSWTSVGQYQWWDVCSLSCFLLVCMATEHSCELQLYGPQFETQHLKIAVAFHLTHHIMLFVIVKWKLSVVAAKILSVYQRLWSLWHCTGTV